MYILEHYNKWDASGIGTNLSQLLDDLANEAPSYIDIEYNDIVIGWVRWGSNNGMAYLDGHYAVCAEAPDVWYWPNWQDDIAVQHEMSHLFGAQDTVESCGNCNDECIMDYWYAWQGYAHWEWYHRSIIDDNIWRQ
ncbi:hypothetical protein DRP05_03365 [Archaeoglobales archaeon]|nr:MAG: hypothetical protein DRP05_03365 [Archaeoglobales archaeon]